MSPPHRPGRGAEAHRIRERANSLGGREPFPTPIDPAVVADGSKLLNQGILDTMRDLDVLQRAGVKEADEALDIVRTHLGPRYARDCATLLVGAGWSAAASCHLSAGGPRRVP